MKSPTPTPSPQRHKIVQAPQKHVVTLTEVHKLTLWQRVKLIAGYNIRVSARLFCPHNPGPDTAGALYVNLTEELAKQSLPELMEEGK